MGTAIQKITLIFSVLITSTISPLASANKLVKCSTGEILVGQKQVGTASYYAENCSQTWQGQSMQMDFSYSQNIPEWAFKRAATHFLKKNINGYNDSSALHQITQLYRPVKKGDLYRLSYIHSSKTLILSLNQQVLGRIQDDHAQQYFNIWLGKVPFSAKLKQQLLN
ncbi:chalcone isomerase family protein [Acinetobacter sp. ANC 3813]|uniref:chalcone isomerase family protein n=1 Tax=Acinetobacter sp. ANC 3813 TaxID=1977873 RepID=UPI000A32D2CC|nr:chalcone isomerase family protein [Acinetobacter sp. ANC 3813]OTG91794.1 hypothetical protein B9T34_00090 [Acinetobacter sp. ANC 3813]